MTEEKQTRDELYKALVEVQKTLKQPGKSGKNPHLRTSYTNLEDVLEAVRGPLSDHGLFVTQTIEFHPGSEGIAAYCVLVTRLWHVGGAFLSSSCPLNKHTSKAQEFGSELTYMRRYSLMALLGLVGTDDDDDGHSASHREAPKQHKASYSTRAKPAKKKGPLTQKEWDKVVASFEKWDVSAVDLRRKIQVAPDALPTHAQVETLSALWTSLEKKEVNPADVFAKTPREPEEVEAAEDLPF